MATSTRMKVRSAVSVFHRIDAADDVPAHDVATSDAVAKNMGSSVDFELESDGAVVHVDASKVADATGGGVAIAGSATINNYLYIKHSGYTTAAKTTATSQLLKWGIGDPDVNGFKLVAGESILLHGGGTGCDNISEIYLESASGDIYVEIKYL